MPGMAKQIAYIMDTFWPRRYFISGGAGGGACVLSLLPRLSKSETVCKNASSLQRIYHVVGHISAKWHSSSTAFFLGSLTMAVRRRKTGTQGRAKASVSIYIGMSSYLEYILYINDTYTYYTVQYIILGVFTNTYLRYIQVYHKYTVVWLHMYPRPCAPKKLSII